MIHTVKGFSVVREAEIDVFMEFSCFSYDPVDVGHLISGFSIFSKPSFYILKFSVHILLKTSLKDFKHYLASIWNEFSGMVVWTYFGIALLWERNEYFSSTVAIAEFSKFACILSTALVFLHMHKIFYNKILINQTNISQLCIISSKILKLTLRNYISSDIGYLNHLNLRENFESCMGAVLRLSTLDSERHGGPTTDLTTS